MKKYLFYYGHCFNQTFFGHLMDKAIAFSKDEHNEVIFAYCGGINKICDFNRTGSKPVCSLCSYCTKKILNKYKIKSISLKEILEKSEFNEGSQKTFSYKNVDDFSNITYRGVYVGKSILSSYISITRNMYPLFDEESRPFFDIHLAQNVLFVDSLYSFIDNYKPDELWGYNGRFEFDRAVCDIARSSNLKFFVVEDLFRNGKSNRIIYENHLPQDIIYLKELREYCWSHYKMSDEEKKQYGKSFYEKRRHGLYAGDKIYIKDQKEGKLPPIDLSKKNIAIMNSSEDEFVSIGEDWNSLKLFKNQYEGIIYLLEKFPNVHFYLRIHPNLKDVPYSYHTRLLSLEERYKNITVIPGNSDISTYDLMDKVDAVITFGSTMGIESSYWGKSSIMIGPSLYSYDDVTFTPKSLEELNEMIINIPKAQYNYENILKFGAFSLDRSPLYDEGIYIDWSSKNDVLFGKKYYYCKYLNIFGTSKITAIIIGCLRVILGKFGNYTYPIKEDVNW